MVFFPLDVGQPVYSNMLASSVGQTGFSILGPNETVQQTSADRLAKYNRNQILSAHKEVYAPFKSDELRAEIDRVFKEKPRLRARPEAEKQILRRIADGTAEDGHERRIVKTKRFGIEPMFEEDAVAEMEELGHSFFLFVNAESERLNVLYRRKDGDYGLIEPILGGDYTPPSNGARPAKDRRSRSRTGTP